MTTLRQEHGDSFFNHRVAKMAHDMVMAMDPDDAVEFAKHVSYGMLQQDIENNRRTLDGHVREVSKRVLNGAAAAVRKGAIPIAAYDEIAKSLEPVIKSDWDESGIKRDRGGKFSTTESRIRTRPGQKAMPKKQERSSGIPSAKALAGGNAAGGHKMSSRERSAYQQQYLQLVNTLDRFDSVGIDSDKAKLVLEDKNTGARYNSPAVTNGKIGHAWDASRYNLVGVRSESTAGQRAQAAGFDMVSAISETGSKAGKSGFSEQWNNPSGDTPGTNERTYRRVKAGADLVNQLNTDPVTGATINAKVGAAAGLASLAGQYGPQAEQVLGPHARKTAYRYRGTERKPDAALMKLQGDAVNRASVSEKDMSASQLMAHRARGGTISPEEKQNTSALAAQQYLFARRPDPKLSDIQRKSGKIPPSEGVLIGADGEIKHQSVGFADDHYLPFNLKNLKDLKGGQYVRTRTSGGLTTEDIYTGLVSGARSVTVVSNSGIFTVDFADDLRGGRRMSDKAASMVGQYGKTLDAIKEGKIEREPIVAELRAQILTDVQDEYQGLPVSREEIQGEYDRRVKAYRELPVLSERELKEIDTKVSHEYPEGGRSAQTMKLELQEAALETRQDRHYKLDGEGYAAASRALREQFPYFIGAVHYQTKNSRKAWDSAKDSPQAPEVGRNFNNRSDSGYVKPRHNKSDQTLDGYYDKSVAGEGGVKGTGKTRGDQTNYQNWEQNPLRRGSSPKAEQSETPKAESKTPEATGVKSAAEMKTKISERQAQIAVQGQAAKQIEEAFRGVDLGGQYPAIALAQKEGFAGHLADPTKSAKLTEELETIARLDGDKRFGKGAASALATLGSIAGGSWSAEHDLGKSTSDGFRFEGTAYAANADKDTHAGEVKRVERSAPGVNIDMDDSKLSNISRATGTLSAALSKGDADAVAAAAADVAQHFGGRPDLLFRTVMNGDHQEQAKKYAGVAEGAERLRALKKTLPQGAAENDISNTKSNEEFVMAAPLKMRNPMRALMEANRSNQDEDLRMAISSAIVALGAGDVQRAENAFKNGGYLDDPDYDGITQIVRDIASDD